MGTQGLRQVIEPATHDSAGIDRAAAHSRTSYLGGAVSPHQINVEDQKRAAIAVAHRILAKLVVAYHILRDEVKRR